MAVVLLGAGLATIVGCAPLTQATSTRVPLPATSVPGPDSVLLFTVPVGGAGFQYEGVGRGGVFGFAVAPDGSFWLGDAGNRLLHWSPAGAPLAQIALRAPLYALSDVQVHGADLWVLDGFLAAPDATVYRLAPDGQVRAAYPVPELQAEGVFGLRFTDQGAVLVARSFGPPFLQVADASGVAVTRPLDAYVVGIRSYPAAGLLGVGADGSYYRVGTAGSGDAYGRDQLVLHNTAEGALLGRARLPVPEPAMLSAHQVALGPDGAVYVLVAVPAAPFPAVPSGLQVRRLPLLPPSVPLPVLPLALPTATEAPRPTPRAFPPLVDVASLAFVDEHMGWALGTAVDDIGPVKIPALRHTTDGGQTWIPLPAPFGPAPDAYTGAERGAVQALRFADARNGWAFGGAFFTTHDGGLTSTNSSRPGDVVAVAPAGGTVWAVERACAHVQPRCTLTLLASADNGQTWQPGAGPLPFQLSAVQLVRQDPRIAYLLAASHLPDYGLAGLWATRDAGHTWAARSDPCSGTGSATDRLALGPAGQLWLACGAAPADSGALYMSSDGGQRWELGTAHLPANGSPTDLVVTSATRGWLLWRHAALLGTTDAGRTWHPAFALQPGLSAEPVGAVTCVDAAHCWVGLLGRVLRTTDGGGHWFGVDLP